MAIEKLEVYKCEVCGNMTEVIFAGGGDLVCCGSPMVLLKENTTDAATEKHVPVYEKTADGIKVQIGSVAHPMEESHFIQWIQLIADGSASRQFLSPGDKPEAVFKADGSDIVVREYCNLHGLWKA